MTPKLLGNDIQRWSIRIVQYLDSIRNRLSFVRGDENLSENGILMWDGAAKEPVVSVDGQWVPLVLQDGQAMISATSTINPVAANTEYDIVWSGISGSGVTLGTPASRVVFEKGGVYLMAFSAQVTSASASLKNIWFWPKINGVDVLGATMKLSIHDASETFTANRTAIITVADGDYLEAAYEVDDTNISIEASPAGTNAPSAPSVTLAVTRIHQ